MYLRSYSDWLGETAYERIETPDEDYDRMKQEELDREMEAHDSDPARTKQSNQL